MIKFLEVVASLCDSARLVCDEIPPLLLKCFGPVRPVGGPDRRFVGGSGQLSCGKQFVHPLAAAHD